MTAYLPGFAKLMLGAMLLELHMTGLCQPFMQWLVSPTVTDGKSYFVYQDNVGLIPRVDGVSLDCHVYFGSVARACLPEVANLPSSTDFTVHVAHAFGAFGPVLLPLSITV